MTGGSEGYLEIISRHRQHPHHKACALKEFPSHEAGWQTVKQDEAINRPMPQGLPLDVGGGPSNGSVLPANTPARAFRTSFHIRPKGALIRPRRGRQNGQYLGPSQPGHRGAPKQENEHLHATAIHG